MKANATGMLRPNWGDIRRGCSMVAGCVARIGGCGMVSGLVRVVLVLGLLAGHAAAESWQAVDLGSAKRAQIDIFNKGALAVTCGERFQTVAVRIGRYSGIGEVAFTFDDKTKIYTDFRNGQFSPRNDHEEETWSQLIHFLRTSKQVGVTMRSGVNMTFPLSGSRAALTGCGGERAVVQAPSDPKKPLSPDEVRELKKNMVELGKWKGPVNGVMDGNFAVRVANFGASFTTNGKRSTPRQVLEKTRDLLADPLFMESNRALQKAQEERHMDYGSVVWQALGDRVSTRTAVAEPKAGGYFLFSCQYAPRRTAFRNHMSLRNTAGQLADGPLYIRVDTGPTYQFEAKGLGVAITTEQEAENFKALARDIVNGNQLAFQESNGTVTQIPLAGSARAMEGCVEPIFEYKLKSNSEVAKDRAVGPAENGRFNGKIGDFTMETLLIGDLWCRPHVAMRVTYPRGTHDPATAKKPPREVTRFALSMSKACPVMRSVLVVHNLSDINSTPMLSGPDLQVLGKKSAFTKFISLAELETRYNPEPAHACDLAAAFPGDFDKPVGVSGVPGNQMQYGDEALSACQSAVSEFPEERRFRAQLARVLAYRGGFSQAISQLKEGKRLGSGAAMTLLGTLQVEGWGTSVDMAAGNAHWRRANFYGGWGVRVSRSDIARASNTKIRPTKQELEQQQAARILTGLAASLGSAGRGGSFTMCNNRSVPIRVATIAAVPIPDARVFIEGFDVIQPDGACKAISSDVNVYMVFGVAIEERRGSTWVPYRGTIRDPDDGIPHRFTHVCVPNEDSFVRNEFGMMSQNPCRSGDRKLKTTFNVRVGRTDFTMTVN